MTAAVLTMPPRPLADGRAELLDCALSVIRNAETHTHQDVVNACFYLREYGGPTGGVLAEREYYAAMNRERARLMRDAKRGNIRAGLRDMAILAAFGAVLALWIYVGGK